MVLAATSPFLRATPPARRMCACGAGTLSRKPQVNTNISTTAGSSEQNVRKTLKTFQTCATHPSFNQKGVQAFVQPRADTSHFYDGTADGSNTHQVSRGPGSKRPTVANLAGTAAPCGILLSASAK